jgi:hypothetical protein
MKKPTRISRIHTDFAANPQGMASCRVTQILHHAAVTRKRRKVVALILLALIGGVIAYSLLRQDDEPKYQGRRLS